MSHVVASYPCRKNMFYNETSSEWFSIETDQSNLVSHTVVDQSKLVSYTDSSSEEEE